MNKTKTRSGSQSVRLLIVDDEAPQMTALCDTLTDHGYETVGFTSAKTALQSLRESEFDVLLSDLTMPDMDGIALLNAALEYDPNLVGIIMTGNGTIATAVEAMKTGALDYILKPFKLSAIIPVLNRAVAMRRLRTENIQLREIVGIYELSMELALALNFDAVIEKVADAAYRQSDHGDVAVMLPIENGKEYHVAAARGTNAEHLRKLRVPVDAELTEWLSQVIQAPSVSRDVWDGTHFFEHPLRSSFTGIAIPMIAGGKTIGILIFNLPNTIRVVTSGKVKAMSILAGAGASALEAALLLGQLEQRVRERTAELEAANRELEAFSYSVSHDLRAPLRAIDGFSRALQDDCAGTIDEQGQEHLRRVRGATKHMSLLIDDLLQLFRVSRGDLRRERIDLSGLAHAVIADLRRSEPDRFVETDFADGVAAEGDRRLLQVVLENLLGNAWKFTANRPVARVEFGLVPTETPPAYFVRDNGAGFDMEFAGKLFGAFQRLHSANEFPGTGIGLASVQRIIHRHGGRVWAQAAVDQGATFYFTLRTERNDFEP